MPGLLSIDDEGVLSVSTERAIASVFPRRSELPSGEWSGDAGGEALPGHFVGVIPAHQWTSPVYNHGSPVLALIRGMIAAVIHAEVGCEIVIAGDSKSEGYNAGMTGQRWRYGWVGILRAMLGAVEGTVLAYTGGIDSRWTTNMVDGNTNVPGLLKSTGTPTATLTFGTSHTGGAFWVRSVAGGTITVAVDGGAAQSFNVPAGNGFKAITPTVTGTGSHTYVVTGATLDHLYGFRPTYSGVKLKVTNLSRSGATALGWLPGASATQSGHWDGMLAATAPDAIIGALGTNQPTQDGPANATNLTAFWAAVAALGKPALITTPGGLDLSGSESWFEQYRAQLKAADTHNLPLLDHASVIGTGATAQARGLMFDAFHENRKGFAYEAAALFALIGTVDRYSITV